MYNAISQGMKQLKWCKIKLVPREEEEEEEEIQRYILVRA
jgi:hypothetical protein